MRAYVITTGVVFALITVVHVFHLIVDGGHTVTNHPWALVMTVIAAGLSIWAFMTLRRSPPA